MAVVVVDQTELAVVVFTAPLDGLRDIAVGCHGAVGRVGVGRLDIAVRAEDLADVFREIPAVGVPSAVLADAQRTCGDGLRRVPEDEPLEDAADGVDGGDLQVAPVDVAQVVRDAAVDRDLARVAAAHVVIGAFHDGCAVFAREGHGAVLGVVDDVPDAGACLDLGLIAVRVAGLNRGVLVQVVGVVGGGFFRGFLCRLAVADVIVAVAVGVRAEGGRDQFAAVVVREGVVLHAALPGGAAVGRASEGIIAVAALDDEGAAAVVLHAGEQVAVLFIALREREPVRVRQGVQQVRAAQVAVAELPVHAAVHEAGGGDAAVCSIAHAGGDVAAVGPEGGERGQVVSVVVAEEGRLTRAHPIAPSPLRGKCCAFVQSPYKPSGALNGGAPFGDFAAAEVVLVAGGFALGVGDDGGLVEVLIIDGGGAVTGGVGDADGAPGEVGVRGRGVAAAVRGGLRDARGGVGSGEGAGDALMVALRGDEAIHDPSGCREGGGGDGFAVQSGHAVIVSISDDLRACQAVVFCFRDIGRELAVLPCSTRASSGSPTEYTAHHPAFIRWLLIFS